MILMAYLMKVKVSTISRSVKYIIGSITGVMVPSRILIIQRKKFLSIHLEWISTIYLIGRFKGRFGDLGDAF